MHTTMQTLGRVAIVGGGIFVSLINIVKFSDISTLSEPEKVAAYADIYRMALIIPLISILGVSLAELLHRMRSRQRSSTPNTPMSVSESADQNVVRNEPNWWILGGTVVYVLFSLAMGLLQVPLNQEIVFAGSMAIVVFLINNLLRHLPREARRTLIGTAIVIFVFRALPGPGAGASWWQIDELGFDEQFMSILSLIGSCLALGGMFVFRRFMVDRSIFYVIGFLTVIGAVLSLPVIGMYYGLHVWTANLTHGVVDARFIAVVDTALESPLGQVAMIPMLAWIANSAPVRLKATFFAVMASFTNLALSAGSLGTKYLNQVFTISRQVLDPLNGRITVPADYSELGIMLITVTVIGLLLPCMTILLVKRYTLSA
jgi:hypothetical protein